MAIIEDLGMTDLEGKLSTKRRYYKCSCDTCTKVFTIRADRKQTANCGDCNRQLHQQKLVEHALTTLAAGTKKCSCCKQLLPLEAFGRKTQMLTGFRSICKECRFEKERKSNQTYIASVRGKLVSANSQGRRREFQYKTNDNSITIDKLEQLKQSQNNCCAYCNTPLQYDLPRAVHLDHVIPLSKNGTHTIDNVVWACQTCNLTKSNINS